MCAVSWLGLRAPWALPEFAHPQGIKQDGLEDVDVEFGRKVGETRFRRAAAAADGVGRDIFMFFVFCLACLPYRWETSW